ncbi:MAG: N-myristoyl transferase [Monoraphidium minutum]|nr:MAG: N-myristoyl transferase [Monoraphidium minutum]
MTAVQARLAALSTRAPPSNTSKQQRKERYAFWETQPVVQFEGPGTGEQPDGPIDKPKAVADVRQEPYPLPDSFEWCECDVGDAAEVKEVYELLHLNYVEDDDAMFRFNYSPAFLQWALQPPGFRRDWHVGVRVKASRKLVAFISAIPATVLAAGQRVEAVEINFLCVHKKLRAKRLAPEITRRVNLTGIWQAAYTAGVVLPKPVSVCRYWHRSLNPKKLIDVGFSSLAPRMTMARTIKLYKLPPTAATPGLRPMVAADAPAVARLLNSYLRHFKLAQHFSEDEVRHWLTPRALVVDCYVVDEDPGGGGGGPLTDMVSFYTLPSSVLGHPEHSEIRAAYMFYTVAGRAPLQQLLADALALAASKGYDVFNALDLMENGGLLKDLKFGIGDGTLQYYLFNWAMAGTPIAPAETGLILL